MIFVLLQLEYSNIVIDLRLVFNLLSTAAAAISQH